MLNLFFLFFTLIFLITADNEDIERDMCMKIRHNTQFKRDLPTLVGAGASSTWDDSIEFDPKLVLYYNFENQESFLNIKVVDESRFNNDGRFSPGGLVLKIPGSTCGNAAYLPASDIILNGETFQAKPTYGITIAAWIMLLDIKGRHNIFETYGLSNQKAQFHFEVDYGILRWFHSNPNQGAYFEVAAELIPQQIWTHVAGTYNSTTGISQIFINGKAANRTWAKGKMSKDWSCLAHMGGQCKNKALLGFMDEIRIYNHALESTEIRKLFEMCTFTNINGKTADVPPSIDTLKYPSDILQDDYFVRKTVIPDTPVDDSSKEILNKRTFKDKVEEQKPKIFS